MRKTVAFGCLVILLVALTVLTVLPKDGIAQVSFAESLIPRQQKGPYLPTGAEATISGTIEFTGKAPKRNEIDMGADPICVQLNDEKLTDDVLVSHGKLANVFIYVKSSSILDLYEFKSPEGQVVLQHRHCRYVPRILGVRVNQTLQVLNSDRTAHNTNSHPQKNLARNLLQRPEGDPIEFRYTQPETFIKFRCNQHPWEIANVGVFDHPFYAVSDSGGTYKIEGLPPGTYTIVAWHETLGDQPIDITVSPQESRKLNFSFK